MKTYKILKSMDSMEGQIKAATPRMGLSKAIFLAMQVQSRVDSGLSQDCAAYRALVGEED